MYHFYLIKMQKYHKNIVNTFNVETDLFSSFLHQLNYLFQTVQSLTTLYYSSCMPTIFFSISYYINHYTTATVYQLFLSQKVFILSTILFCSNRCYQSIIFLSNRCYINLCILFLTQTDDTLTIQHYF